MSPRPSLIPDAAIEAQNFSPPLENIEKESETSNQEKNEPNNKSSTNRARESSCR